MRLALLLLAVVGTTLLGGCSGDDGPEPTSTPPPATATAVTPEATATPSPPTATAPPPSASATAIPAASATPAPAQFGPDTVVETNYEIIGRMYDECESVVDAACLDRIVEEASLSPSAQALWKQAQVFLVSFEEHGPVDFGAVSSPIYNMARPEPVFLNGSFGLLYLGEVIPRDWQSEPGYAGFAGAVAWQEYSRLRDAASNGAGQVFTLEAPLQDCRACPVRAYLSLAVSFEDGALGDVEVLPPVQPTPTP